MKPRTRRQRPPLTSSTGLWPTVLTLCCPLGGDEKCHTESQALPVRNTAVTPAIASGGRDLDEGSREEHRRVQYLPTARAPGRQSWAELFTLVGAISRIASDRDPAAVEAMGRIRDAFAEYEENRAGDRGNE